MEEEPKATLEGLRADFALNIGNSRYFYDIQVVSLTKDSAKGDPYSTLIEAAEEKRRKYSALGTFFRPLIFSAGGLMEPTTAKAYKELQHLLTPSIASWLDTMVGLALVKTRAISAASIATETPRSSGLKWAKKT